MDVAYVLFNPVGRLTVTFIYFVYSERLKSEEVNSVRLKNLSH